MTIMVLTATLCLYLSTLNNTNMAAEDTIEVGGKQIRIFLGSKNVV